MPFEIFIPLLLLSAAMAWTPGPNNALVASSGASFGFRRSLPHVLGIAIGYPVMVLIVGLALGELFEASQLLRQGLRWLGAGLLVYLAWVLATSHGTSGESAHRPFTFLEAAGFQWVNPKGWAAAIAVTSQFITGEDSLVRALIVAVVFFVVGLLSASTWAMGGTLIRHWLNTPERLRVFNITMAILIVASVVLVFIER